MTCADAVAVADHRAAARPAASSSSAVVRRLRREELDLVLEQLAELERLEREREAPGLDLLQVEEVVDERRQPLRLAVDRLQVALARVLVEVLVHEQLGEAEHARERRAQLVRDGRDELGLEPRGLALGGDLAHDDDAADQLAGRVAHRAPCGARTRGRTSASSKSSCVAHRDRRRSSPSSRGRTPGRSAGRRSRERSCSVAYAGRPKTSVVRCSITEFASSVRPSRSTRRMPSTLASSSARLMSTRRSRARATAPAARRSAARGWRSGLERAVERGDLGLGELALGDVARGGVEQAGLDRGRGRPGRATRTMPSLQR